MTMHVVSAFKGGSGKTLVSLLVLNSLLRSNHTNILIFDANSSNPDLLRFSKFILGALDRAGVISFSKVDERRHANFLVEQYSLIHQTPQIQRKLFFVKPYRLQHNLLDLLYIMGEAWKIIKPHSGVSEINFSPERFIALSYDKARYYPTLAGVGEEEYNSLYEEAVKSLPKINLLFIPDLDVARFPDKYINIARFLGGDTSVRIESEELFEGEPKPLPSITPVCILNMFSHSEFLEFSGYYSFFDRLRMGKRGESRIWENTTLSLKYLSELLSQAPKLYEGVWNRKGALLHLWLKLYSLLLEMEEKESAMILNPIIIMFYDEPLSRVFSYLKEGRLIPQNELKEKAEELLQRLIDFAGEIAGVLFYMRRKFGYIKNKGLQRALRDALLTLKSFGALDKITFRMLEEISSPLALLLPRLERLVSIE